MSNTNTVHRHSSTDNHESPQLWTHVVNSRRKGNNKQQQSIVSFNPTLLQRPRSEATSAQQALNGESPQVPMAVIRPFLKGAEEDSVFIDLTPIKDRNMLNKALLKFNEASNDPDMYEDFLGYRRQPRHYLNHAFLETMWLHNSEGRKTLLEDGITLEDGTFIKGFASYPADATIVKISLENLPYLPALQLKEEMAARLSAFGDVLDHGISKTDGIFQGEGYATLNLTVPSSPVYECQELHLEDGPPCPGHRHLEELSRVIVWDLTAMDQRKSPDHCRADCPDYKKWVTCFHCGGKGHVAYNCPRNDSANKVRAVENTLKPRKAAKENKQSNKMASSAFKKPPVVAPGRVASSPKKSSQGKGPDDASAGQQTAVNGDTDNQTDAGKHAADKDDPMTDLPQHQGTEEGAEDVDMAESTSNISGNRAVPLEKQMKKIGKVDGAEDFSSAKQLAATSVASIGLRTGWTGPPSPPSLYRD